MDQRVCKKCLLRETSEEAYFQTLYSYIENIDENIKVNEQEYQRRLNVCKGCDNLLNGLCSVCGCFVELRAVIKTNYCPAIDKGW